MVIFISKLASAISEHLRGARNIGILGFYRGQDDRSVKQAAALVAVPVFVLNSFLLRFACGLIFTAISMMLLSHLSDLLIEVAWGLMLGGMIAGVCCMTLDFAETFKLHKR